ARSVAIWLCYVLRLNPLICVCKIKAEKAPNICYVDKRIGVNHTKIIQKDVALVKRSLPITPQAGRIALSGPCHPNIWGRLGRSVQRQRLGQPVFRRRPDGLAALGPPVNFLTALLILRRAPNHLSRRRYPRQ